VILRRSDGRILVHRRAEHKDLWPGRHDLACGGVIGAGESPEECAHRELAEEVGVVGAELRPVLTTWYRDRDTQALVYLYEAVWDGEVRFADGEVAAAWWMERAELEALLAGPERLLVPDSRALWPMLVDPVEDTGPWPVGTPVVVRSGHRGRTSAARLGSVSADDADAVVLRIPAGCPTVGTPVPGGPRVMGTSPAPARSLRLPGELAVRRRTARGSVLVDVALQVSFDDLPEDPSGDAWPCSSEDVPSFPPDWDLAHVDRVKGAEPEPDPSGPGEGPPARPVRSGNLR